MDNTKYVNGNDNDEPYIFRQTVKHTIMLNNISDDGVLYIKFYFNVIKIRIFQCSCRNQNLEKKNQNGYLYKLATLKLKKKLTNIS